ncbi:sugar transferase, partial [Sulfurovum sp. bin170]|uniref:sugar transferase n=1 Tax=Sulfurovum sp. bin170 TaxID=2695268 RepID=UPI0013DEC4C3
FEFFQKRVIDLSLSSLLLILTSPIILFSIYQIRKESAGSILFTQPRVGLNGESFTCYKFRSMHTNMGFNPYTQDKDPRIFPFGRIMRKMRIDELPQLWNVIRGEMHLIGPRAEWDILVNEYEKIIPKYQKRHIVRPGITGLAQVSYPYGRNVEDAREKLKYDLNYIKKWSIMLEIKVIWKTIMVVLGQKGV